MLPEDEDSGYNRICNVALSVTTQHLRQYNNITLNTTTIQKTQHLTKQKNILVNKLKCFQLLLCFSKILFFLICFCVLTHRATIKASYKYSEITKSCFFYVQYILYIELSAMKSA